MVITITMKNVRLRNGIYEFRMAVPADCQDSVGKKEITQSLKTSDPAQADVLAKELTADWKAKFKAIRAGKSGAPVIKAKTNDTVADFKAKLNAHMNQHLDDYLVNQSEDDLVNNSEWLMECIAMIKSGDNTYIDLSEELGVTFPLPAQKSPGMTRRLNKAVIGALAVIRGAIDTEAGWKVSEKVEQDVLEEIPKADIDGEQSSSEIPPDQNETNITAVMNLMIDAKNLNGKYKGVVRSEVKCLQEWLGNKTDITTITKSDMVNYARNCLPYIPKNREKKSAYSGKSLKECVAMVKGDTTKYTPISHQTCKNRYAKVQSLFTYAQTHLGLISTNPATGIEIPEVRVGESRSRGFTDDELTAMWNKLNEVVKTVKQRPERYWVPIIGLYHGLRLNEICSLLLRDVYLHDDGMYVIDINANRENKRVKNKSSVRIIPFHPYVIDTLGFRAYIERRKAKGATDRLVFPNLTYTEAQGYAKKMSVWFNKWKTTWLPAEAQYKHFHDLRHRFSQQAQNQAKMPDRYSQEITGHEVKGVSNVHLNYSGRLKPKDLLIELAKIRYGWE